MGERVRNAVKDSTDCSLISIQDGGEVERGHDGRPERRFPKKNLMSLVSSRISKLLGYLRLLFASI